MGKENKVLINNIKQIKWYNILMAFVAGVVNAVGVVFFLVPISIVDGGLSGTSFLLSRFTALPLGAYIFILNLPFFLIGIRKQGITFMIYSMISVATYAICAFLFQNVFDFANAVRDNLGGDVLIMAVFGGLISGLGSGLTIRSGGAMDGVEVMAVLFAKRIGLTVGQFVMAYNVIQFIAACFLLSDMRIGLYSILAYAIGLKAVDFVVEGFDRAKACYIITQKAELLGKVISTEMRRGITLIDSKGFYSNSERTMMYCVVNRFEIGKLRKIIESIDPTAFVTVNDVSETMGRWIKYSASTEFKNDDTNIGKSTEDNIEQ